MYSFGATMTFRELWVKTNQIYLEILHPSTDTPRWWFPTSKGLGGPLVLLPVLPILSMVLRRFSCD